MMEPGTCSNPSPSPAIREHPLIHMDVAWYILAEAEAGAGIDCRIAASRCERFAEGSIPVMEARYRIQRMQTTIDRVDASLFADEFTAYLESGVYFLRNAARLEMDCDPLAPARGRIPVMDTNEPFDSMVEKMANDAILAYGIRSVMPCQPEAMTMLGTALKGKYLGRFPGNAVFEQWNGKGTSLPKLDATVLVVIKALCRNRPVEPDEFWVAGLRMFEWINQSDFKYRLTVRLAAWLRSGWKRITTDELFRLYRPRQTVPAIMEVLTNPADDRRFVAKVILVTAEAVGSTLAPAYRRLLDSVAEENPPENQNQGENERCAR